MHYSDFYRMERIEAEGDILDWQPSPEKLMYNFLLYCAGIAAMLMFYILLTT